MKRRRMFVKIMAIVLAVLMLGSLVVSVLMTMARAGEDTGIDIDELQGKKAELHEKQNSLKLKKPISPLKNQKSTNLYTALKTTCTRQTRRRLCLTRT